MDYELMTNAVLTVFQPQIMAWLVAGLLLGFFIGALPGFNDTNILAMMLPFSVYMGPLKAVIFMMAVFGGSPVSSVAGAVPVEAFASAVPGVGRFLAAVDVATATQSARVTELAGYAGSAAAALDWMAGAVTGTDGLSSAALDGMMPA